METDNFACIQDSTASHLLINGTEREARTRIFDISSSGPSPSSSDTISSCRGACLVMHIICNYIYGHSYCLHVECPSENVSSLHWPVSYVGTQLTHTCSINSGILSSSYCRCKLN